MPAVNRTRPALAGDKIVPTFGFYNVSALFATDAVADDNVVVHVLVLLIYKVILWGIITRNSSNDNKL